MSLFEHFLAPPWARKFFLVGAQILHLKYDAAKVRRDHCGSRILPQDFFKILFQVSRTHLDPEPWKTETTLAVILVIWSFGQNHFRDVKIRHYNKYFIFIYSEQMTESENENDHFDLDHFDQHFGNAT